MNDVYAKDIRLSGYQGLGYRGIRISVTFLIPDLAITGLPGPGLPAHRIALSC